MKSLFKISGIITILLIIGFLMVGCDLFNNNDSNEPNSENNGSGNNTPGSTKINAITVISGHSSSHTISQSGQHWFKYVGTGNPVIVETRGNVVDTYIEVEYTTTYFYGRTDDNSGEGSNALLSFTPVSGETYYIKITTRSSTNGTYTFVVTTPTTHLRTNPITVAVGNSSSHIINSSGEHWFKFTGNGNRVFFETDGKVVNTNMSIYIGENSGYTFNRSSGDPGINFYTVSGTIYYIKITGNSGTYTFNINHGSGDGSSKYYAKDTANGYSASHTITTSGEHWFIYQGTGNPVTFKTLGNVVDTYIEVEYTSTYFYGRTDDNSGEGSNALLTFNSVLGETYYAKITTRSSTYGTYTFVVE